MSNLQTTNITNIIKTLILRPQDFTPKHAQIVFSGMMQRPTHITPSQIAAFLVALKLNGKDNDPEIIAAYSLIDVVGTGGDGMNTFNVSTASAIVIAGAGCKVAKCGNRAASSKSGSADILEKLGCEISKITPERVAGIINKTNFCFLFAQVFHPAVKNVAQSRSEIGVPTIFNLLGPLTNPAKPRYVLIGVHSKYLGSLVVESLKLRGVVKKAMVVHGAIGLDEISPEGETFVWHLSDSKIEEYTVTPSDFGLESHPISSVKGGTSTDNAELLKRLLSKKNSDNHSTNDNINDGAILDFILLNSSAALVVAGIAKDFKDGVKLARESITSGKALKALEDFRKETLQL
nr:8255_t:CDS:2 [Entrophospora candida]CAG8434964.1 11121_t:CDS:2 [Entrophospora candida]